ncbi:MAG: thioredoxin family protein [Pseudomonadota bacterium]
MHHFAPARLYRTILLLICVLPAATAWTQEGLPAYSRGYSAERDPFADGRDAIALAQRSGRRILIEVGGDWCTWCHVLDRVIRDNREVERALRDNFVVMKVNVSDANDNAEFMQGLPKVPGYPKLFVSRSDGSIIHAQDPSEFLRNGSYDAALVLAFLRRWAPHDGD